MGSSVCLSLLVTKHELFGRTTEVAMAEWQTVCRLCRASCITGRTSCVEQQYRLVDPVLLAVGEYLVTSLLSRSDVELVFVWNRSGLTGRLPPQLILDSLDDVTDRSTYDTL